MGRHKCKKTTWSKGWSTEVIPSPIQTHTPGTQTSAIMIGSRAGAQEIEQPACGHIRSSLLLSLWAESGGTLTKKQRVLCERLDDAVYTTIDVPTIITF